MSNVIYLVRNKIIRLFEDTYHCDFDITRVAFCTLDDALEYIYVQTKWEREKFGQHCADGTINHFWTSDDDLNGLPEGEFVVGRAEDSVLSVYFYEKTILARRRDSA